MFWREAEALVKAIQAIAKERDELEDAIEPFWFRAYPDQTVGC